MRKIIFVVILLFFPLIVNAECSKEEISRLKNLASKIETTYDYVENDDGVTFSVTFHNVYKGLKIVDDMGKNYSPSNNEFSDITISNIIFGGSYSINIVSNSNNCLNQNITKKYYSIPYYNSYYKDELCEKNRAKTVCQKWLNTNSLTYEQFVSNFNDKEQEQTTIQTQTVEENFLTQLFVKYYYILFGAIILISLTVIIIINRKDRFNFNT